MESENKDTVHEAPHEDVRQKRTLAGVLSYLSVLVVVAYLIGKDDAENHFHIKQGFVLLVAELAVMVILSALPLLFPFIAIAHIILVILSVIGIINVLRGKKAQLPLIGHLAKHVPNL